MTTLTAFKSIQVLLTLTLLTVGSNAFATYTGTLTTESKNGIQTNYRGRKGNFKPGPARLFISGSFLSAYRLVSLTQNDTEALSISVPKRYFKLNDVMAFQNDEFSIDSKLVVSKELKKRTRQTLQCRYECDSFVDSFGASTETCTIGNKVRETDALYTTTNYQVTFKFKDQDPFKFSTNPVTSRKILSQRDSECQ